ncbi:MAG TPA: Stk1 family PASTA domain-containing Ser/Thr kinase [Mycobacteriales bacterium]
MDPVDLTHDVERARRTLDTDVFADPGPVDALVGRLVEGRYEIVRPIDRGGMATVYVALDHRLDREVAIKVMHASLAHDPDFVARFEREAKAAARINHPNVVSVTDTGVDGHIVFLVMELVRGRTLRELLRERGRLSPDQALEVLEPVLTALAAAQSAGLVHRDVKPENVLLGEDGSVKVADFGLARAIEASGLTTHAGLLLGTVAYLPPEQVTTGRSDGRGDVYAAGVVLFEMLTGTVPYEAETPIAVAYRHVHEDVPGPSSVAAGIPTEVDDLVLEATAREQEDRFPDAESFLTSTRRVRRQLALHPSRAGDTQAIPLTEHLTEALERPKGPTRPTSRQTRRHRRRWPIVLVVLVMLSALAAGLGVWLALPSRVAVPELGDRSLTAVEQALTAKHLPYRVGATQSSDTVLAGSVIRLLPGSGSKVKPHTMITIVPSGGVLKIDVPTVAKLSEAAATQALTASGLAVGLVTQDYDNTVPIGFVISSDPSAGTSIDHRTKVTLKVSKGPAPVAIPDVTGQPQAQAVQTLTGLGLKPVTTQAYSDTIAAGLVISADPHSGTGHVGDTVKLVISQGPQMVAVPKLNGLSAAAAAQALTSAGLVPKESDLLGSPGNVVFQNPAPNTKVKVGTTVTFYTG